MFIVIISAVLVLFAATPALQQVSIAPQTDFFTEFWILGAYHNATYPYNVTVGGNYHLYFDVSNHLGQCANYVIEVKFRNESQPAPDSFNKTDSNQPSLGNITFFAADKETVEIPVDFSFDYKINAYNTSRIDMQSIIINGEPLNASATSINWDPYRSGFYGNLFFELWILNDTTNTLQYHQRFVSLWLNMTT